MANGIIGSLLILLKTKSDTQGLLKTEKAMRRTSNTASLLTRSMRALSAIGLIFGGKSMIGSYLEFEKNLGAIHSRFYAITGDANKANQQFENVRNLARSLGQDMFSTAEAYSIFFAGTAKSLGEEGAKSVFESWSKVGRVLHLTPYQMERVTYALREMSSKGAIYSQDLRMQIGTHVPNAMGIATQAIKNLNIEGAKTFDDFQKKAKGNQPLINRFIREFTRISEMQFASPEAMREAMKQPDALLGSIRNVFSDFGIAFSKAGGKNATSIILESILEGLNKVDFNGLAEKLATLVTLIGKLVGFLASNIPALIQVIKTLIIALTLKKIGGVANSAIALASRMPTIPKVYNQTELLKRGIPLLLISMKRHAIMPIIKTLLKLFGGIHGLIISAVMSALLHWGPTLWNKLTNFIQSRKKTIDEVSKSNEYIAGVKAGYVALKKSGAKDDILQDYLKNASFWHMGKQVMFTDASTRGGDVYDIKVQNYSDKPLESAGLMDALFDRIDAEKRKQQEIKTLGINNLNNLQKKYFKNSILG